MIDEKSMDEDSDTLLKTKGTVLGTASCNTKNNGLAYRIEVDDFQASDFIITATLPDDFKQEGLKITFDMTPSNKGIAFCTANYYSKQFYELSNINIIANRS